MTERTFYFLSWNGRTKLEHYVEHNGSSLSSGINVHMPFGIR